MRILVMLALVLLLVAILAVATMRHKAALPGLGGTAQAAPAPEIDPREVRAILDDTEQTKEMLKVIGQGWSKRPAAPGSAPEPPAQDQSDIDVRRR